MNKSTMLPQAEEEALMKLRAICFDFGDTLADEATEEKDAAGVTLRADLIPGAAELVFALKRRGYPLALVADGYPDTYRNVLTQHGIYDCFDVFAISEEVGVCKPDPRMFTYALDLLHILPGDYAHTIMVGNHLERDIKGANQLGMISVWLDWAPRRAKIPADDSELPRFSIRTPHELLAVVEAIEAR
jgi:putative hydrolase of the HAD superfamily